jgi:hypothetical protein
MRPMIFPARHARLLNLTNLIAPLGFFTIVAAGPHMLRGENAEEILRAARMNPTAHPAILRARIRGEHATPLLITLRDGVVRYEFSDPKQTVFLKLDPGQTRLSERTEGPVHPIPQGRLHEQIRDTGVTYQDLSLGFLYWPCPILQGEETIRSRAAWKIDLQAPPGEMFYGVARVWIDKESGALLRIEGYDKKGLLLKRFEVVSAQKIDGLWMLKQMRIEGFVPGNPDPVTRRYLEVLGKD